MSATTNGSGTEPRDFTDLFSERAAMARPGFVGTNPRAIADSIAFSGGYPDPGTLPIQDIIESTRIALERDGEWALQYGFGSGIPELVTQLSTKLKRDQGIEAGPQNILITNGSSHALALIFELFVNPGDTIIAEAPWFMGAIWRARASGCDVREVPLDDEGLDIGVLEQTLKDLRAEGKRAKFLYCVPTFQNPSGITYTLERRKAIVKLAQEYGMPILEDDAYYDLRFEGQALPPMYTLDDQGLVMYCGTFSKIMAAGMRLGWCVANPQIIARLAGLKTDSGTSPFSSHIAAQFAAAGTLVEHINHLRPLYQHRRDVMIKALEQHMPEGTTWTMPQGGFFIWMTLPDGINCSDLANRCQEGGVSIGQGAMFFYNGGGENQVRLSYSFNSDEEIERGVQIMGEAAKALQQEPAPATV